MQRAGGIFFFHRHRIPRPDDASPDDFRKYPLPWHDAVAHPVKDGAVAVAFFSDLGDFQNHSMAGKSGSHRHGAKIHPFHQQILPKGSVLCHPSFLVKRLHFLMGKQADLPMPVSGMGIPFDPKIFYEMPLRYRFFLRSLLFADTDRSHDSHRCSSLPSDHFSIFPCPHAPNPQSGYTQTGQFWHRPPWAIFTKSMRVSRSPARILGTAKSNTVRLEYMTHPGSPMTGIP